MVDPNKLKKNDNAAILETEEVSDHKDLTRERGSTELENFDGIEIDKFDPEEDFDTRFPHLSKYDHKQRKLEMDMFLDPTVSQEKKELLVMEHYI